MERTHQIVRFNEIVPFDRDVVPYSPAVVDLASIIKSQAGTSFYDLIGLNLRILSLDNETPFRVWLIHNNTVDSVFGSSPAHVLSRVSSPDVILDAYSALLFENSTPALSVEVSEEGTSLRLGEKDEGNASLFLVIAPAGRPSTTDLHISVSGEATIAPGWGIVNLVGKDGKVVQMEGGNANMGRKFGAAGGFAIPVGKLKEIIRVEVKKRCAPKKKTQEKKKRSTSSKKKAKSSKKQKKNKKKSKKSKKEKDKTKKEANAALRAAMNRFSDRLF